MIGEINAGTDPRYVNIQQFIGAPTTKRKLSDEKHRLEVKRYILSEWMENDKRDCLIICQLAYHEWLKEQGLPENIYIEHYNDIAGRDRYKFIELLIQVGRTQPRVRAVEAIAGALFGEQPLQVEIDLIGDVRYDSVDHGIRLRDGSGIRTKGKQHPDPIAESVRWQIEEGELLNALGRARAINRGPETPPLKVRLLFDNCLPITCDNVQRWKAPSLLIEAAVEGFMSASPSDLVQLWPVIFHNVKAAKRAVKSGIPVLPGFVKIRYQVIGARQKLRTAYYDPKLIPDPQAWLQGRLGRDVVFVTKVEPEGSQRDKIYL